MSTTQFAFYRCLLSSIATLGLVLVSSGDHYSQLPSVCAQETSTDEELARQQKAIDRFLSVLEKSPRRGTALDRVYGFHVESGTLDALVGSYQQRVAQDPKDRTAWTILGLLESQRGHDAAAVEAFTKADAADQPDAMSAYYRGQSLVLIGQPEEAIKAFELAISRKPAPTDLLEIFQSLGRVHQRAQRTQEALDVWNRLEKLFPNDARVHEQIAVTLAEEGQNALALPRYEKLIQLTKDDYRKAVYRIEAAELKVKLNRSQEAIADLEKLIETLNPTNWLHRETRRKIEDVFLRSDDQDGLSKYYQASVAKHPDDIDAMARLSRILARQGRVPEAQVWLDKSLKLAPSRKDLRQAFIDQLVDDQRFADALAQYELLDKADPNNPDVLREWGKVILRDPTVPQADRAKRAEKVWRRMLESRPKDPLVTTQVADLFRHSEMTDAALELYKKAVTLAPDQPQYLEYLGEYYHKLKRTSEALSTWRKITDGKQRTAANLARLAEVLSSFGYLKEAIPEIQAACELDRKDLALHVKAADLLTKAEQYTDALTSLAKGEKLAETSDESESILSAQLKVYALEDSLGWRTSKLIDEAKQKPPAARQWYLRARFHEAQRQYTDASHAISDALKLEPQSVTMLAAAARIYEQAGDLKAAVDLNRRLAITDRRGRSEYLKYIAQLETQLGRVEEALKAGRDLIAAAPGNTDNHQFYANLCFRLDKADEGFQTLRRAVRINPNEPKMVLALAEALANQYRTDEAIELYWKAFDKSSNLDEKLGLIDKLTNLYLQTNHLDKLLERIDRLRREADDKRETTICLAQAHSASGDLGTARQELESLLTDNTRDTQLLSQLSKLASSENDLTGAVKYQQQLAKLAPGPETEYRLATLLTQTGAVQESVAVTLRLASRETDQEKLLKSVDALINAGQDETALLLIDSKLRERPQDWELMYREGALLAKKDRESAARRFRVILDLPLKEDTPGIILKNQSSKVAKAAPAAMGRLNSVYYIRTAVGLGAQDYYNSRAPWVPVDFGQARIAALGWLLRFARDTKQEDDFIAGYQRVADDPKALTAALWDAANVIALKQQSGYVTSVPEAQPFLKKLAARGELDGQYAYLFSLQPRATQTQARTRAQPGQEIAPLSKQDLELMVASYQTLQKQKRVSDAAANYFAYASIVMTELKRAGLTEEADKLYQSAVAEPQDTDEFAQAFVFTLSREDVPRTLELLDKWWNLPRQDQPKNTFVEAPFAQLMGIVGAAKKDAECLQLLDKYLDHHQVWANKQRQKLTSRSNQTSQARYEQINYYFGKQQLTQNAGYPRPGLYYDPFAISVLRTAYEIFHRNDVTSDLQRHLAQRLEKSADGDKVYGHLALAYLHGWSDDKESALKEMEAASSVVGQDWRMKLEVARLHIELQNFDDALSVVETIAPIDQDSMRERESLALSLSVRLGDHDRAQQAAERLFGLRLDAATQMELARQMRVLGMNDQAEAVMSRVQRQAGSQLSSLVTLMNAHQGQGRGDVAVQIAHQILRRSRPSQVAITSRGISYANYGDVSARNAALQVLRSSGKLKEIIAATEEQFKRAGQSTQLVETLSEYYEAAGDQKKATELVRKLVDAKPNDIDLRYRYARKLSQAGNANEACEQYKIVLRAQPSIMRNEYYEISQIFERAKKTADLVKIFDEIDLKQLGHYSYATNLVQNLMSTAEQKPIAFALLRKCWEAFPDSRSEMLRNFAYDDRVWEIPEFYQYGKQSLFPVARLLPNDPWNGFGQVSSFDAAGMAKSVVTRVLDAAAKANQLPQLREEIVKQVAEFPTWKAGPVIVALIDVRLGQIEAVRPVVQQLADEKIGDVPIDVRWIFGQELESDPTLRPLVIKIYEATVQTDALASSGREFSYSPGPRLLKLYVNSGQRDRALKLLASMEKLKPADNYDPIYAVEQQINQLLNIGQEYETIDSLLDAARVYRTIQTDSRLSDPAIGQYTGNGDYYSRQVTSRWSRLMTRLAASPELNLTDTLLVPNVVPNKPVLDLMLAVQVDANGIPKIDSQLVTLCTLKKATPEASTALQAKLQDLILQYPEDLSVRIVAAALALSSDDAQQSATRLAGLKSLVERSPLEVLVPGQRANARQREAALRQVGLWMVAKECLKQDVFRSDGELLAARAVEAAKRQMGMNYPVAIYYDRVQAALQAKDLKAAEEHLSLILTVALTRPHVKKSAAPVPGVPSGAKPVVSGRPTSTPKGPMVASVPPITLSQFRTAMVVADIAAEHRLLALATRAMSESLVGGFPVADPDARSESLSSGVAWGGAPVAVSMSGMGRISSMEGDNSNSVAVVTTRVLALSTAWRAKHYPPEAIYAVLKDIVFPKSRSGDIVLYEQVLANWKDPQSLGRELVRWATALNVAAEVRKEIEARQSTPAAVLKGTVLLAQLALATNDDAAAIAPLKKLAQLVKEQPRPDVALTAIHAAGLAMMRPGLTAEVAPILEEGMKSLARQNPNQADNAAMLLARHYLHVGKVPELRAMLESHLQAKQIQYSRSNQEYALYRQRLDLGTIVSMLESSKELPLFLEYVGRLVDTPPSPRYGDPGIRTTPLWHLARRLPTKTPGERYALLKDWVLPTANRQSLRYLNGFLRGQQLPTSFLTADEVSLGTPPPMRLTSSFSLLVDAARDANKLDELQAAADHAVTERLPHAEGLSILVALARSDATVTSKLQAMIDATQQRATIADRTQSTSAAYLEARTLETEIASVAQANDVAHRSGQDLIAQAMREARAVMQSGRVSQLARVVGEGGLRGLSPPEQEQLRLPNLKLWHVSTPPQRTPDNNPPAWWSAQDGLLTHVCGLANDSLFFRYPLAGTFEFAFDIHSGHYAEGPIGYGGLVSEPQFWNNGVQVYPVSRHETVRRGTIPIAGDHWNRYAVRVTPEATRFYCNGHLLYEEPAPSLTSPWVAVHAQGTWRSTFRNFQLTGEPVIPRQVELVRDNRMEGWIAGIGERLPPRLLLREPPPKPAENERVREDTRPIDWSVESGVLQGRRDPAAAAFTQGFLSYHRPLQDGDTLKYKFLYEPGQTLVHPALDNLALLLEPTGVQLHCITLGTLESARVEPGNTADEPQHRRGPATLPLQPGSWNQVELSLAGDTLGLKLNGELIFERPLEAANSRQFGLFHYRNQTEAKVRNIVLTGNWPEKLSPQDLANLLAPENPAESPALQRARQFVTQEEEIVENAYQLAMSARALPVEQRYDLLREWVLPSPRHSTVRLQAGFTPVDPPVIAVADTVSRLKGKRQHIGGELVAPVLELMRTASELKRLDHLEQAVREAESLVPGKSRDILSLKLLLALTREDDAAAAVELKALADALRALDPTTQTYLRHAELTAINAALDRAALRLDIVPLTEFYVNGNRQSGAWDYRLRGLRGKALWLNSPATRDLPQGQSPPQLTQWTAVSHPTAESRARGYVVPTWSAEKGRATFFTGHGDDALYFQSPLTGNFELRMKRTTFWWREIRPMYANLGVELQWDGQSIWQCLQGHGQVKQIPLRIEKWSPVVDYRLVVQDGQYTAFVNGQQIYSERLRVDPDPWLSIQTAYHHYDGQVEDVQILGTPTIPEMINLSAASNLQSWRATYYGETIDATSAVWKKDREEIVGALHENSPGSQRQSVLQYHRPLLEDGEIQYNFFYETGKTEVHPALDRATFILTPGGIQLHYLTDAAYDRTGLAPDNSTPLADSAKTLKLKDKDWNTLKLALVGDVVTLSLNGEKIGTHKLEAINQRIFGLFRYSSETASRIKKVTYRGNWPKQIPTLKLQELAAPN